MIFTKRMNRKISEYQNSLMEKHYEEVENMYRQTRGWRHDYRNHIQTMKAYLQMGQYEKLLFALMSGAKDRNFQFQICG